MKKYCRLFGIVLSVALLAFALSSCNESMTNQMDRVVDTEPEPPTEKPVVPPTEEPVAPPTQPEVTTPEPVAPLPEGTVVFVEPRRVTSPAAGEQLQVSINVKDAADVLAYEVTVGFDPTALRYVSITNADYLPAGAFAAPPQVTTNQQRLSRCHIGSRFGSGSRWNPRNTHL